MPLAPANGLELWYETFGDPADPPLLLIMGLGAQAIAWPDELCEGFVDRGFFVIRFDNRDVGLSAGAPEGAQGYLLADMAADVVGLLDHLAIPAAHVVGASMGGMIAQQLAIDHPGRLLTLTSIMSSTGEADVGQPDPAALELLLEAAATDRAGAVAQATRWSAVVGSPEHRDEDRARDLAGRSFDRAFRPDGMARQLQAIVASPPRTDGLATLTVPTLVIHGSADRLIDPSGGRRTAELVAGAVYEELEGMGHDLPVSYWSRLIEAITRHAAAAAQY